MTKKVITLTNETGWKGLATKLLGQFKERIKRTGYKEDSSHLRLFFEKRKDTDQDQKSLVLLNWPGRLVESFEVAQLMNKHKIRPVNLPRFLYLGQQNPEFIELAKKFTIVTFGSFWRLNDAIFVPAFYKDSLEYPDLLWFSEVWGRNCWFAGLAS